MVQVSTSSAKFFVYFELFRLDCQGLVSTPAGLTVVVCILLLCFCGSLQALALYRNWQEL